MQLKQTRECYVDGPEGAIASFWLFGFASWGAAIGKSAGCGEVGIVVIVVGKYVGLVGMRLG